MRLETRENKKHHDAYYIDTRGIHSNHVGINLLVGELGLALEFLGIVPLPMVRDQQWRRPLGIIV